MKNILVQLVLWLWGVSAVYAEGTLSSVSANVVQVVALGQNEAGNVITSGEPPLYCSPTDNVMLCWY